MYLYQVSIMKEQIGATAGKIWNILREHEELAISRFPRMMKEKTVIVHQALGWLAREDKITYRAEGNRIYVALVESEKRE
ncbi:hypothetical protein D4R89_06200 [bacterium]|nr:MAG: hypothetical protein D4R89_06200 [bacterium]